MKHISSTALRAIALLGLGLAGGAAQAHTGHGTAGLVEGLAHPLGADHWLAMLAVGLWSVKAWPTNQVWRGPATFVLTLLGCGVLGTLGWQPAFLEHMISLSVVLFGAMLVWGSRSLPAGLAMGLIAVAGGLHGWAHGAETPASGFATYALGFVVTTVVLHACGAMAGLGIRRALAHRADWVTPTLGAVMGGAGVYLLGQL